MHPHWTEEDLLLFIGDDTDWWNLYSLSDLGKQESMCMKQQELGGPHWTFAWYGYDSRHGMIVTSHQGVPDF